MRRILAVLIVIIIAFLVIYGVVPPVKAAVDAFFIGTAGPVAYGWLNTAYITVISSIGVAGFAAMVLGFGFVIGMVVHFLWVKSDWGIRRWAAARTRRDLGVSGVSNVPSTPVAATTRPEPFVEPVQAVAQETAPIEQTKESDKA